MKQLLVFMMTIVFASSAFGQARSEATAGGKCSLTVAQSPAFRGIRLGMGLEELLALFPGSQDDDDIRFARSQADHQIGAVSFNIFPTRYATKQQFAGINQLVVKTLDERLSSLYVGYNGPEWKSVDEFITRLSESLHLPGPQAWEPTNLETMKTLKCEGFELTASIGGSAGNSNYVLLRIPAAEQAVRDRQAEAKEKARREFKP